MTPKTAEQLQPRKCSTQVEFDDLMRQINEAQTDETREFNDRLAELDKQRAFIQTQKAALNTQLDVLKLERLDIERRRKDINREYYDLKHQLITLNPKGLKNEGPKTTDADGE